MSKSRVRSPTFTSSPDPTSPFSLPSPRSGRTRELSNPEPFPDFASDGTASTLDSKFPIPQATLLSRSGSGPFGSLRKPSTAGKQPEQREEPDQPDQSESDRTDALWAEMQAILADVELSASRGTHFFGSAHADALEDLRNAQIELAKAWAKGESETADDEASGPKGESQIDADSGRSPGTSLKGQDADGADGDAETARQRRQANDRYFSKIQRGVLDVVEKLDGVAQAMGKVERESREIWSESESEGLESSSN